MKYLLKKSDIGSLRFKETEKFFFASDISIRMAQRNVSSIDAPGGRGWHCQRDLLMFPA